MGKELESYPCFCFNYNQMKVIKMTRPRRSVFLNPGVKSTAVLIKSKCKAGLAKRRSIIKTRKLNLSIKPGISSQKLGSDEFNGSLTHKKGTVNSFRRIIPVKPYLLVRNNAEEIKFVSQEKEVKSLIPAKPNVLINKSALNQVTCSKVNYPFNPVKYIATNKESNIPREKSICRIERSTLVGAYLFQRRNARKSCIPPTLHPGENHSMVKYKKVSEKSETKELIKNSDRPPYCFTIRSRYKENSLYELFRRKPLMTTLKHSCNSLSGIYKQECIERMIPLKHPLCLKLQKMTFQSPKRYKDKMNFFRCPFFAIKRMNLITEHSSEKI
jgi:hypothetical protein